MVSLILSVVSERWGLCHWQTRAGVVGQIGQGLFPGHWIPLLVAFLVFLDPSSGLSLSIFCSARPQTHSHPIQQSLLQDQLWTIRMAAGPKRSQ